MRSVDVVLPASMCAMIPMLRVSSSLNTRPTAPGALFSLVLFATASATMSSNSLPAIMRECLVCFRHAMHVFLLLHGAAACVGRVNQFIRKLLDHGLAGAFARILQKPANRQRLAAERVYFDRNLIVRTAHAPRFDFQHRLHVLDSLFEKLQSVVVALLGHLVHRAVKHALRGGLLAFPHHRADELLDEVAAVDRVGSLCATAYNSFAWHVSRSLLKFSIFTSALLWAASLHTSSVPAFDSRRPRRPRFRARCGSARPAGPSRGRRARARWSAPASCGRCRECTWSLRPSSSGEHAQLCAARSSVSSAFACTRECTRRAFPGSPSMQATSS